MSDPVTHRSGPCLRIHDASIVEPLPDWLFSPDALAHRGLLIGASGGRRQAHFIAWNGRQLVLRHYWRGGMVARFSSDVYVWLGIERSRPVREWRLLVALRARGLTVPRPVAAQVCRAHLGYRGDLITEYVPDSQPWEELLRAGRSDEALWRRIGATLRRFHAAGAWHADLNVRNILVDARGEIWLIDWDRGRLLPTAVNGRANLKRLRRSLDKDPALAEPAETGWVELLRGYGSTPELGTAGDRAERR